MKPIIMYAAVVVMALSLTACGDDETTIVHEKPVIVQTPAAGGMSPASVEATCPNGYDNSTHRCY